MFLRVLLWLIKFILEVFRSVLYDMINVSQEETKAN